MPLVALTGTPGVGKTTLVKKICRTLESRGETAIGFYTEEIREKAKRIGFDMVRIGGDADKPGRISLARINNGANPRVGQYGVNVQNVENVTKKAFGDIPKEPNLVLVIDEIGKMELLSDYFVQVVSELCFKSSFRVLCTIPVKSSKGRPIKLVEDIRQAQNAKVFEVTRENRDSAIVKQEVINALNF